MKSDDNSKFNYGSTRSNLLLTSESAAEHLVVVVVDRVREPEPPHCVSGGRVHQAAVAMHVTGVKQEQQKGLK